jgi:hypothetical protein
MAVEEPQRGQQLLIVRPGNLLYFDEIHQEVADLFPAQPVRAAAVEVGQAGDRAHVGSDRMLRKVAQVHLFDHALAERCHRGTCGAEAEWKTVSFQHALPRAEAQVEYSLQPISVQMRTLKHLSPATAGDARREHPAGEVAPHGIRGAV